MKIIFLEPIIEYKVWGGTKLRDIYNYPIEQDNAGEAWLVACFENKSNYILNSDGMSLYEFYNTNKEFFNYYDKEYPLLVKIIDAKKDLSVQVHPDDAYAKSKNYPYGKTECWYILDCKEDSTIIYGHNANDYKELKKMIENKQWENLLNEQPIKKNELYYIPSGTIHAIKSDTLLFELQQSSDITYRIYDYDRLDENGKLRELHLNDALNVINFDNYILNKANAHHDFLVDTNFFKLIKLVNREYTEYHFPDVNWLQATVIKGFGTIDGTYNLKKGDTFLVAHNHKFSLNGELTLLISYV